MRQSMPPHSLWSLCNWHADRRHVCQSCCPWIERAFLYQRSLLRIQQCIQPASRPQTACNHTSPWPPHAACSSWCQIRDPEVHCCAVHPRPSPHVAAWWCAAPCCKDPCTIPGSWKYPSSCMASTLTGHVTHWACLGAPRIGGCYMLQFLPIWMD